MCITHSAERITCKLNASRLIGMDVALQEASFLRDLGLYANNLGTAATLPHANLTSWTW